MKRKSNKRSNKYGDTTSIFQDILKHKLLTKAEEHELGQKIQRAIRMQEMMDAWVEANMARLEDIYYAASSSDGRTIVATDDDGDDDDNNFDNIGDYFYSYSKRDDDDEEYFEESDLFNQLMYGTTRGQAVEQYQIQSIDDGAEELYYQDGTPFFGVEDFVLPTKSYDLRLPSLTTQQPRQYLSPASAVSWVDELLLQEESASSVSSWLTDDDVRSALDLPGGRAELKRILMEGALARQKLINSNIKLVRNIAVKWVGETAARPNSLVNAYSAYSSNRPTVDEAMQEGILGLAEAADRFSPERGLRFSTYATFWVTNFVRNSFNRESSQGIRLPGDYYDLKRKYVRLAKTYVDELKGTLPPIEEIALELGVSANKLTNVLRWTQPIGSIDSQISTGAGGSGSAGKAGDSQDGGEYTLASLLEW